MLYKELALLYEKLEKTTKRLEKTLLLSRFFSKIKEDQDLKQAVLLAQGTVFPPWDSRELGIASKLVVKAISRATGLSSESIEKHWAEQGDLGLVAEIAVKHRKQQSLFAKQLTVDKVFKNLQKAAMLEGQGTVDQKIALVAELINCSTPLEARYIVRTVIGALRVGIAEGMVRDALTWAFLPKPLLVFGFCHNCGLVPGQKTCPLCSAPLSFTAPSNSEGFEIVDYSSKQVNTCLESLKQLKNPSNVVVKTSSYEAARQLYNNITALVEEGFSLVNDYSQIAVILKNQGLKGLEGLSLQPGRPFRVMLAQKVETLEEGFKAVGKPAAIEYKYDGFRMQIHKQGDKIVIYTRRLENVTKQFPDVVNAIKESVKAENCILDGECVGIDPVTKKFVPFQNISQRIKRKYNIQEMVEKLPVELHLFDIVFLGNETIVKKPFKERRKLLESVIQESKQVKLATQLITADLDKAKAFYNQALNAGNEGVMLKALNMPYKPGSRVGFMVKLKPTAETFDLAIVGAEWGEGKRAHWLSSFVLACKDEISGEFLTIGKVGTGIKEKSEAGEGLSFEQLTELLKPHIVEEKGRSVTIKPSIVVEVTFQEIQRSPSYTSGFALRFPRVLRLRLDKSVEEVTTLNEVSQAFERQGKKPS